MKRTTRPMGGAEQEGLGTLGALARGSLLGLVGMVGQAILNFVLVIIVTRGLAASGAGVFFQMVAIFTILAAVSELGAGAGMVRFVPRFVVRGDTHLVRTLLGKALWPVGVLAGIGAMVVLLVSPALSRSLDLGVEGERLIRIVAPFVPLAALTNVMLAAIRGFGGIGSHVLLENLGKPALRPVAVVAVLVLGFGSTAAVVAWLAPVALLLPITALVLSARLRRGGEVWPGHATSGDGIGTEFWRFAGPRGMAAAFQVAILWLDTLLVGALASTRAAGIYAAVGRLAVVGVFAMEAMRLAIAPAISTLLAKEDRDGAQELYRVGTWWLIGLSWPFYITLILFAPVILRIFGSEFVAGEHALVVVATGILVAQGAGNVTVMLLMGGKSVWNLANTMTALAVNVGLNLVLIPRLGLVGAAIAWLASELTINGLPLLQIRRLLGITPFGSGFLLIAGLATVSFAVPGIALRAVLGPSVVSLAILAVVSIPLYLALLVKFRSALHLQVLAGAVRGSLEGRRIRARRGTTSEHGTDAGGKR